MKIRNKILISFSSTIFLLIGIIFVVIYLFYSAFREEEFQQRQKQKISTTLFFLTEIKKTDDELIEAVDHLTINDLFDEKLLLFDENKQLIYSSVDDTPITISKEMLSGLNSENQWIETKDGLYDVVGTYIEKNGETYFGISKAYDTHGYSKLYFLRNSLLLAFLVITISVFLIASYLAKKIARPLADLANLLSSYRLTDEAPLPKRITTTTAEIISLNDKFNELVNRTHEAFAFQKHSIQHISHQLKTPITVLISELERIKDKEEAEELRPELEIQIVKTKSLADIINILLEILKTETDQIISKKEIRIDEVIFDCVADLNQLYPHFHFEINYTSVDPEVNKLIFKINKMLIRQVFQNLLSNCIAYSDNDKAEIKIDCSLKEEVKVIISNSGKPLSEEERKHIFNHFFRGENSWGKTGFGLGLVLTQKILALNSGSIRYTNPSEHLNVFEITLPIH